MLTRATRRWLARFMLACFALAVGVAAASPLVHPRAMQWVCTGATVQLMVDSGDGMVAADDQHTLDCALCLLANAPPGELSTLALPRAVAPEASTWAFTHAAVRPLPFAPLPARGPPSLQG